MALLSWLLTVARGYGGLFDGLTLCRCSKALTANSYRFTGEAVLDREQRLAALFEIVELSRRNGH